MDAEGIEGKTHMRALALLGPVLGGGRADPAALTVQLPRSGPAPTVGVSVGTVPSGSSGAGSVPCSESSADTGRGASSGRETPSTAGAGQPSRPAERKGPPPPATGPER